MTPEERKAQSIKVLKECGIPYIDWLPVIDAEEEGEGPRSAQEIARRAVACLLAIQVACDICEENDVEYSREFFEQKLENYDVKDELTEKERIIFNGEPTQQDAINMAWKYEAYWVLLWALGIVEELSFPDDTCDCEFAIEAVDSFDNMDSFMEQVTLRDWEEILQEADLIYRYDWAVVQARVDKKPAPAGMDSGVVFERHWAFNWLLGKNGDNENWDDVSTDT